MLLNFTSTYAMSINVSKDSEVHIVVSDFVGEVNLTITRFNMVIYSSLPSTTGIFDVNLGEVLGTLDLKASDSAGNSTDLSATFDNTTIGYNQTVDLLNSATPVPAISPSPSPTATTKLEFTVGKKYFYIYSPKKVKIDMDVQTVFDKNANRVLVPVRFFAEALGYNVTWDESTGEVTISSGNTIVSMQKDSEYLIKNDEIIKMDEPLQILNDRTYMPIRFVGEAFGYDVNWDAPSQTATLSSQ